MSLASDTYHSCWGSSMTNRILNFLDREGEGADCSTNPAADAAVCLTALVMELKELKKPEEPPEEEEEDWACWGCWASWLRRRSWVAGELAGAWAGAGALVGDWAGAGAVAGGAPCWEGEVAVGGTGAGGSGLWRSVMYPLGRLDMKLLSERRRRRKFMIAVERLVSQSMGLCVSWFFFFFWLWMESKQRQAEMGMERSEVRRWKTESRSVQMIEEARDGELLLCWSNEEQGGQKNGCMKQWIQLWSSLQETALQSAAKPAGRRACMWWWSSSRASRLHTKCAWRKRVCVWERGVVSPPSARCCCSPPSTLPSCLLSCCKPNALKRCCSLSLCLSHPLTHSRSLCPFPLARSHSARRLPLPLRSPVIILLHHWLRVCVVLQPCGAACRVQPLEGVSC